jgi:dihydroorotate dehydrogenase (NAD+) catalytic subunit
MVHQVARAVSAPIIGIGGIANLFDVVEFLMAGASAVQIGTANFYDPTVSTRLVRELSDYCTMRKIERVSSIIGVLKTT